jgi:hypothetical protein
MELMKKLEELAMEQKQIAMEQTKQLEELAMEQKKQLEELAMEQKQIAMEQKQLAMEQKIKIEELAMEQKKKVEPAMKLKEISKYLKQFAMEQKQILSRLPDVVVGIDITPSLASQAKDEGYSQLLESLNIDAPVLPGVDDPLYSSSVSPLPHFPWLWPASSDIESESYKPLCEYLESCGLFPVDVSSGQYLCYDNNLFDTTLWSIRKYNKAGERELVLYKGRVTGSTDIVVLRAAHRKGDIGRNMVRFVIEVKTPRILKENVQPCIREGVCQLLGMCGDNGNTTPAVVLTDLATSFYVIYLTNSEPPGRYTVNIRAYGNLYSACELAQSVAEDYCTADFGRSPYSFTG